MASIHSQLWITLWMQAKIPVEAIVDNDVDNASVHVSWDRTRQLDNAGRPSDLVPSPRLLVIRRATAVGAALPSAGPPGPPEWAHDQCQVGGICIGAHRPHIGVHRLNLPREHARAWNRPVAAVWSTRLRPELGIDDVFGQSSRAPVRFDPLAGEDEILTVGPHAADLQVPQHPLLTCRMGVRGLQTDPRGDEGDIQLVDRLRSRLLQENGPDVPRPSPAQFPQRGGRGTRGPGPGSADQHHHGAGPVVRGELSCCPRRHNIRERVHCPLGRVTDTDSSVPLIGLDSSVGIASAAVVIGSSTSAEARAA